MKLEGVPFQTIDWAKVPETHHPGAPGVAVWRTREVGNVRVRRVDYPAGYVADHWCARGHVVHVLEGELLTELRDGRAIVLRAGETYLVADGDGEHRSSSRGGASLLIVD
ncbi:MAG: DHCW motif cupin fold protein [Polyangiaceae bacterium]